jgi:hypothetical protein
MARSRAYPVVSLEKAAELASAVVDQLGHGSHDRDSLAQAWGYQKGQGLVARKIAALVQYGMLERDGASYSLSPLADELLHPKDEGEFEAAKARAFSHPTLFGELVAKFQPHGRVPGALANILYRDHGIMRAVAEEAAGIFLASGSYAGVISADGQFLTAGRRAPGHREQDDDTALRDEEVSDTPRSAEPRAAEPRAAEPRAAEPRAAEPRATEPRSADMQADGQTFQLTLSSGQAVLRVPARLTKQDVLKLTKLLDLVALDVEGGAP